MSTIASFAIGTGGVGSTLLANPPLVTITEPAGTVSSPTANVTFTYFSPVGRTQESFRAVLYSAAGAVLEDSGVISGVGTSYAFGTLLQGFTSYRIDVEAFDGIETGVGTVTFLVETPSIIDTAEESRVGSVYEVAINGLGFMLADRPDGDMRYTRRSATLEPDRFADSSTPFSEAIERYTMMGHNDWTGGAGQRRLSRPNSDPTRYWDSEGIDPFEPGQITLLNEVAIDLATTYTNPLAVTAGNDVYVATDDNELTHIEEPGGAETPFTVHGSATVVTSLTSDGEYWYWTDGANIYRNNAAASASAAWSSVQVTEIAWCSDRLVGLDTAAGTPNVTTFSDSGAEEVPSGRFGFPGAQLTGLTSGDGYVWWGANRGRGAQVYAWKLGSEDAALIALSLPHGEVISSLFFYLGNVFVATVVRDVVDGEQVHLYRCVPSEGRLTPELFLTQDTAGTQPVAWSGRDRFVAFSWKNMTEDGSGGFGVLDLSTGGYAKWHTSGTSGEPVALLAWHNEWAFTVQGEGLYTVADHDTFVDSGWLVTSSDDLASSVQKVFDKVTVNSKTLVGTIGIEWSRDTLTSWNELGTMDGAGSTVGVFELGAQVTKMGFRLTLTAGVGSPTLESLMVQLHPLSFADQIVVLPLRCADRATGLNGQEIDHSGPGRGDVLARWVEALVPSRVSLQDVDWPVTREAVAVEAVSAETNTEGVYDRQQGRRVNSHVVMLTVRRRL